MRTSSNLISSIFLLLLLLLRNAGAERDQPDHPDLITSPGIIQQYHPKQHLGAKLVTDLRPYVDPLPSLPTILGYDEEEDEAANGSGRRRRRPKFLTIGMFATKMKFHRDLPPTTVFAYGTEHSAATFPGPAIEAVQGVPTYVRWENHLPSSHILPVDDLSISAARTSAGGGVPTVVHLHGGVVQPESDGNIDAWFTANYTERGPAWSAADYTYPNAQHPGNLIYHDHARGYTRLNVLAGLIGPYVIRNTELEARLNLPAGPEFDRHLLIADKMFTADGSIFLDSKAEEPYHVFWRPGYFGRTITVNGKVWPYLKVKRRKYRFRIVNACNNRYLDLRLTERRRRAGPPSSLPFTVVGSDSTFLATPVDTPNLVVANAEIYDVVVDFSGIVNEGDVEMITTYIYDPHVPLTPSEKRVMKFIVEADQEEEDAADTSAVPPSIISYSLYNILDVSATRYIYFHEYDDESGKHPLIFKINGRTLSEPATERPRSGSTELWNVINPSSSDEHSLHVHVAHMQAVGSHPLVGANALQRCMAAEYDVKACNVESHVNLEVLTSTPEHQRTWKNVVDVRKGTMTRILVKFNMVETNTPFPFDATAEPGYLYHCHVLGHEDNEMIRPLKLIT